MEETKYGGTVTNVKRERVPSGGSNYSKTTRAKACVEILEMSLYFTGNHLYWYRQLKTNEKNTTKKNKHTKTLN